MRPTDRVIRGRDLLPFKRTKTDEAVRLRMVIFCREGEAPIFATSATICRTLCRLPARSAIHPCLLFAHPLSIPASLSLDDANTSRMEGREKKGTMAIFAFCTAVASGRGRMAGNPSVPHSQPHGPFVEGGVSWRLKLYPLLRGRWTLSRSTIYIGVLHPLPHMHNHNLELGGTMNKGHLPPYSHRKSRHRAPPAV